MTGQPVTRHTRARHTGTPIQCPCGEETTVFHFAWVALVCSRCGAEVVKHQWTVAA